MHSPFNSRRASSRCFDFNQAKYGVVASLALVAVACGAEEGDIGPDQSSQESYLAGRAYILPYGMEGLSDEEELAYIESIGAEGFEALVENLRITEFLGQNLPADRLHAIGQDIASLDVLTTENIAPYLTADENVALAGFEYVDASDDYGAVKKGCSSWRRTSTVRTTCTAFLWWSTCNRCRKYTRSCDWWDPRSRTKWDDCVKV